MLVDKTGGPREREAMEYVRAMVADDGRVEAPARLHLGMLAVAGDSGLRFGGLGVAVARPAVVLEAERADELSAEGADAERALAFARRSRDALGLAGGAHLRIVEAIPEHVGLGSGTKLALAVTQALAALEGRDIDAPGARRRPPGRAARSAVGMWTFALGGLVVEGGERPGVDVRRRCWRTTRCPTTGAPCSSCPPPSPACRAAPKRKRSNSWCRRPSGRPRSPNSC